MGRFFERLDGHAGIDRESGIVAWLDRAAFVFLILMVLSSPHSIAATQIAWLTGMFLWLVALVTPASRRLYERRLAGRRLVSHNVAAISAPLWARRPQDSRRDAGVTFKALNFLLWAFFAWSVVTSLTSYAPDISVDKLRGAAVFLIFYFVFHNLRNFRAVKFAAFALLLSCMVNVLWTPVQRLIGRGVEIQGVAADSPLAKARLIDGDTLLEANGKKLRTPDDVLAAIEQGDAKIKFYRPDFDFTVEVKRSDLLPGINALERLGVASWKKSHNWRSSGFYGHYTTYAEVLQLVMALTFGLFVAGLLNGKLAETHRRGGAETEAAASAKVFPWFSPRLRVSALKISLFTSLALMCLALLLTVTRASQLGFLVGAFAVAVAAGNRKLFLGLTAVALPVVIVGLVFLQQSRNVGFLDAKDDSTIYRETMWRDGMRIWTEGPRHLVLGVGMDSTQRYWRDWGMFDGGRMSLGHFHSTPIQLLVERGLPALLLWLGVLSMYGWILLNALRRLWIWPPIPHSAFRIPRSKAPVATAPGSDKRPVAGAPGHGSWVSRGILLGCLGGAVGFFTSGLVHYNLGDQEVAMMFFLLMGLGVRTADLVTETGADPFATEAVAGQGLAA